MQYEEPKTERRIMNIFNDLKASNDSLLKMLRAFKHVNILRNFGTESMKKMNERSFILGREEYQEKMQWINDFARSIGYDEDIFTDLNDYQTASEDYDYYYELKSKRQYEKDEAERKEKKMAKLQMVGEAMLSGLPDRDVPKVLESLSRIYADGKISAGNLSRDGLQKLSRICADGHGIVYRDCKASAYWLEKLAEYREGKL